MLCLLLPEALSPPRLVPLFIINSLSRSCCISTMFYQVLTRKPNTSWTSVSNLSGSTVVHLLSSAVVLYNSDNSARNKCHCSTCPPSMSSLESPFCTRETSDEFGSGASLQTSIIYVIRHHLVCQRFNLFGLHFVVFTPTRAQAPG